MANESKYQVPPGEIQGLLTYGFMWSHVPDPEGKANKTYRSTDIQKIAKVTKMQLVHWSQTGAIVPLEDARGRGSRRLYSRQNLMEALICRELSKFSMETYVMHEVLSMLRESTYKFTFCIERDSYESTLQRAPLDEIRSAVLKHLDRDPESEPFTLGKILGLNFFKDPLEEIKTTSYHIEKHHNLWEFLALYGLYTGTDPFLLVNRKTNGKRTNNFDCSLIDSLDVYEKLKETPCSLVIDLIRLFFEIREH